LVGEVIAIDRNLPQASTACRIVLGRRGRSGLSALWARIIERTERVTKIDVFALPALPAADAFPMMSEDELQELADDIKENGLNQPLVVAEVDGELVLVDGRNRRAACELAKVEPEVRHLNGEDPKAYVLSANIHRRSLTPGQRAMAVAMIRPEPEKRGRGKKIPQVVNFPAWPTSASPMPGPCSPTPASSQKPS
jgi:ParB-like nuclease domain